MSSYEEFGHCSITQDGKQYEGRDKPSNWVFHYYFGENDGGRFIRMGAETKIVTEINWNYSPEDIKNLIKKCKEINLVKESKIVSQLEIMIEIKR